MNYIYDIEVNLRPDFIDFFEWNSQDKIQTIKKLPIIKVTKSIFNDLMDNDIELDKDTIDRIIKKNNNYLIMTNDNIIVVKFNALGQNSLKSSINYTDELDILENCLNLKESKLEYRIIHKRKLDFYTRHEREMIKFLSQEIDKLSIPKDNEKIKYLYLECFNQSEDNVSKALFELKQKIYNHSILDRIYCFFKLIEQN